MKKTIIYAALAVITVGSLLYSCDSNVEKVEKAQENLLDAEQELNEAKLALNAEYPTFKKEAEAKIAANEKSIEELNAIIIYPGDRKLDDLRRQRIAELMQKNNKLRVKLINYENENTNWEVFKREFNHDMKGVLDAIKDFGLNNTRK